MQGWSESRQHVIAHRRGGREARIARCGNREHDAFLCYEMRDQAGTGHGGVSMAGGRECQGARNGDGLRCPSLAITAMFCLEFAYVFRLSVLIRKVDSELLFCVLIYQNSYIFHIYFILFTFLSNTYILFDFICFTL